MQQYWQEGRQTALFTLSQNEADNTAKLADVESWDTPEHRRVRYLAWCPPAMRKPLS